MIPWRLSAVRCSDVSFKRGLLGPRGLLKPFVFWQMYNFPQAVSLKGFALTTDTVGSCCARKLFWNKSKCRYCILL
eukprot:m.692813 g.692813  ORF g.692813 m.692813 type:complete len:76 (+) comp58651_c0_seq6:2627-2854(+)